MTTDYSEAVDAIKKHFVVGILATEPSWSKISLPKFKKYKGQNLSEDKANVNRLVDVEEDDATAPITISNCNGTKDLELIINVEICYANNNRLNSIAFSDGLKIAETLENLDNTDIVPKGFNFLQVQDPELGEPNDDDEFRFLVIPVMCRLTLSFIKNIPYLGVIKDLVGDSDVYKDGIGNLEVYKDVING